MKTLILAGGRGTNLYPLTNTRPKPMIKICGKTILEYLLDGISEIGITKTKLVVGYKKEMIKEYIREETESIAEFQKQAEEDPDMNVDLKEDIYGKIDQLKKTIDTKTEEILNEILPESFSVVKETAKRFKENDAIEVTANDHDRSLAAVKSNVTIQGDKAFHSSTWITAALVRSSGQHGAI